MRQASIQKAFSLALMLGWQDLKQTYRRSSIGPFWITIGMALQIATMGIVFSLIFKTPTETYIPFLAVSITVWGLITSAINEGSLSFIQAENIIKQINMPHYVHVFRVLWKCILTFGHNLIILPLVFLVFLKPMGFESLLVIPGMVLLVANLGWIVSLVAVISARYRDMPPIVASLLTIAFYVTPVMWVPSLIPAGTAHLLLGLNPLYHLLQVVRLPLLSESPTSENWSIASAMLIVGWTVVAIVMKNFRHKIAYWV